MYAHTSVCMYACMYVCTRICMYICPYIDRSFVRQQVVRDVRIGDEDELKRSLLTVYFRVEAPVFLIFRRDL
jgi:hypothetical protein